MKKPSQPVSRIMVGVIVTVLLLGVTRLVSNQKPMEMIVRSDGVRIEHETVFEQVGPGEPVVTARIAAEGAIEPTLIYRVEGEHDAERVAMEFMGEELWEARLPSLEKGERVRYGLSVRLPNGGTAMLPEKEDEFPLLKYKGEASPLVLVLHVVFMFGAFYFMVQSLWSAIGILTAGEGKKEAVSYARWVFFCTLIGGWPLGFVLNYQAFGVIWEGYPFGYDITDNKTQVIFLFWLVSLLLVRGSFLGRSEDEDRLGPRGFAIAVLVSYIVSLFLFIVPHSL